MDRSSEARTLRQVNGRTRLTVDLSEPLGLIVSLIIRLEVTDADLGALQGDVTSISNTPASGIDYNSLINKLEWTDLISFSNIGPYMNPPEETNFDIVVQNSVTPSANLAYNLGQKLLRYRNVWTDNVICNTVAFHSDGVLNGTFTGSFTELRDKPDVSTPGPYVLPSDISLSNLTVEKVKSIGFPEYVYVHGSLYPDGNLHQIGNRFKSC
jgi:hypothetical protein